MTDRAAYREYRPDGSGHDALDSDGDSREGAPLQRNGHQRRWYDLPMARVSAGLGDFSDDVTPSQQVRDPMSDYTEEEEAYQEDEARDAHSAGNCHKGEYPCPVCGASYENMMTRGEA